MEITEATAHLPPSVAGYVVLAAVVLWMARKVYGETGATQQALLDRYSARMDQVEVTLANLTQELDEKNADLSRALRDLADLRVELAAAQASEKRCAHRMERLEARYEKRIAELEHEIDQLRAQMSEPVLG